MAAASCSPGGPLVSSTTKFFHSRCIPGSLSSSGDSQTIGVCKSCISRDFSAPSDSHLGACGRTKSGASQEFCSQNVASSSGLGSGASMGFGDFGRPRRSWNALVLLSSSSNSSRRNSERSQRSGGQFSANARAQEEAATTVKEIADLSQNLLSLQGVVTSKYRAIGPEMRGRVDRLYDRVIVLQQSADRAVSSGSRIPTQLTANLIALQREHGSLENIVRLAMEAAPALETLEATVSRSRTLSDAASNVLLEEAKPKTSFFQSLIRQSAVEPLRKASQKYVMSAPASKGSSPLAAFRAEIERRVIEQLTGKKMDKPVKSPVVVSTPPNSSLPPTLSLQGEEGRASDEVPPDKQLITEASEAVEQNNGQLSLLSAAEVEGTVTILENKLKQLESELGKSIPLQVFEQKVSRINTSLSEARAQVVQLTADVEEKEAMLTAVKKDMLAERDQLMQKVQELTGDLEKKFSVEDMENAVNFGLEEVEKELEEEQDRALLLSIELEKKEKFLAEQQENWRIAKEEMEMQLRTEQDRVLGLSLELEGKEKLMMEREEEWMVQKLGFESDLKNAQVKLQDVRKKRTKERAQLAEKKQKVKMLEQELLRVRESMEEEDKIRLKKKEATYATVRMLITQMVQSSRARAESDAHATTLVEEVAKLQEENQALELTRRAAEEKAGLAEAEAQGIKSNLKDVGREVANLQGELLSGERVAALEKFFAIMAQLIKRESENMEDSSLETDILSENNLVEDEDLQMTVEKNLASSTGDWNQDEQEVNQTVSLHNESSGE